MTKAESQPKSKSSKDGSSSATPNMWTLLLTTTGGQQKQQRHTIQIAASASVSDLYNAAAAIIIGGDNDNNNLLELHAGFPPRKLERCSSQQQQQQQSMQAAGIQNKERIVVRMIAVATTNDNDDNNNNTSAAVGTKKKKAATTKKKEAAVPKKKKHAAAASENDSDNDAFHDEDPTAATFTTTTNGAAASPLPRRAKSKRAAAAAATESFADVIQAQDDMLLAQQSQKKKRSNNKNNTINNSKSPAPKRKFAAASTAGRRLQDGSVIAPTAAPKQRRRRPTTASDSTTTETDPGAGLLGSLQDSSNSGRLMRKNWKQAVNSAYEQNQAVARLAAVQAGTCVTVCVDNNSNVTGVTGGQQTVVENPANMAEADTATLQLQVTYPKGVQGRGTFTDTVDYLSVALLQAVATAIHPAPAARPENLCLLSPRVFWSLQYHFPQQSIQAAWQQLVPDKDWSFLRRRQQQLSAKARENQRQADQKEAAAAGGNGAHTQALDYEAAAAAIQSVEHAMGELQAADRQRQGAKAAAAAANRLTAAWQVDTPEERDEDELVECVSCHVPDGLTVEELVKKLFDCNIFNWRILANVQVDNLARDLNVPVDAVTEWMLRAQQESIEEIIVEICEGKVDAVVLLREAARSGTPKDLCVWRGIVDTLHDELVEYDSQQNEGAESMEVPTVATLQRWCDRAQHAIEQLEWLNMFTTPIEAL